MEATPIDDKYLPIGSVVLLHEGKKRVMIYGRKQKQVSNDAEWDYIACLYPEGNLNEEYMYLFNHDQIAQVFFLGYSDDEEQAFQETLRKIDQEKQID
ncbi:MAG: DUF4176 domain-containing protein [Coriobacteriia bacterium]|nr:DUF4176 domain-containing protein [Coriobacteriia bacterium]